MDRTYHYTIDTGMFFLAEILNKNYKDMSMEDIEQSTDIISNMVFKYRKYNKYKSVLTNGFYNSAIQNYSIKTKDQIKRHLDEFFKNISENENGETCMFCGKKLVNAFRSKDYEKKPTRSHIPDISSTTFSNYINNLQVVNVCPVCLYLSILSSFVADVSGNKVMLLLSDNDEIMEDIAYDSKATLENRLQGLDKQYTSNIDFLYDSIKKLMGTKKIYENGYMVMYNFYNGAKGNPITNKFSIFNDDLMFLNTLMNKSLLSEFKKEGCFYNLINGLMQQNYIRCIFDFNKEKLKVSKDLYKEIEEGYCKLGKEKLNLIKDICRKVYKVNNKDEVSQLKNVNSLDNFREILIRWNEIYINKTEESLFNDIEDFKNMCEPRDFKLNKDIMLMQFMILK